MDDFTLQAELEAMAGNAVLPISDEQQSTSEPIGKTMARWQRVFSLSPDSAVERIMEHRQNLTHMRVSDDHWETVRLEKEGQGHDRESYEYELELQKKKASLPDTLPAAGGAGIDGVEYLVELDGPLSTPKDVQKAAGLKYTPSDVSGKSVEEGRNVRLCCIDGKAKAAILKWASEDGGGYEPVMLVDPRSLQQAAPRDMRVRIRRAPPE